MLTLIHVDFKHQAYLRVQLGINALNSARHDEAADYFTAAVSTTGFSSKSDVDSQYDDLVVVRRYFATKSVFMLNCLYCPALRMGPEVSVANCKPETVPCTPLRR